MGQWRDISAIRREYGDLSLDQGTIAQDPFSQFKQWFEEVLQTEKSDPTAMVLSTVDEQNHPDSRVVLLKELNDSGLVFYTNYQSTKGRQLDQNPQAAALFYWPQMARQVRVRGTVEKISSQESDQYFHSRPYKSQLGAIASPQSREIQTREEIESAVHQLEQQYPQGSTLRPDYWGGYRLIPNEFEFWQGRDNRLHDRIQYFLHNNQWQLKRLAP